MRLFGLRGFDLLFGADYSRLSVIGAGGFADALWARY